MAARILKATLISLLVIGGIGPESRPHAAAAAEDAKLAASLDGTRVYEVRKKVAEFPEQEDLSTPEAAYAAIHRAYAAEGDAAWLRLSSPENVAEMTRRGFRVKAKRSLSKEEAESFLTAEILEVHTWDGDYAVVIARMLGRKQVIDTRWLTRVNGRWLNEGNGGADSVEEARKEIRRGRAYQAAVRLRDNRPPIADPAAHLRPFVEFLKHEGQDPQQFVLAAIKEHRIVILSEVHHRPRYWAFNAALVRSPEFSQKVKAVYLELPSNDQPLVDRFLAAAEYDPQPVIEMLRDMLWTGWPDQPMLDFFRTVWEVNRQLPASKRLRIMLVDMARPWKEIQKREDWRKYDVDRDKYMAENIVRDLDQNAADKRNTLFIVGYGHAMVNFTRPGDYPMKSAGWYLREKLGPASVFAVFPHSPVITNNGQVHGRLALGLFETAFGALDNKPIAFPLDHGPFGQLVFDADPERLTSDPYCRGYHAYLYLGPLEDEVFSPLIPGFYSDEFVRELDRRMRLTEGGGLVQCGIVQRLDGQSFTAWMRQSWGKPRRQWSADQLGPLEAWQYGSHYQDAMRKRLPGPRATTGKVLELYDIRSGRESMASLAGGTVMTPDPKRFRGDNPQGIAWMREKGLDLIALAKTDSGDQGLCGYDMMAVKIDNGRFDPIDLNEARRALEKPGRKEAPPLATMMSTKSELPVTYVIRTRDGTMGVLQIEEAAISKPPAMFRVRYKLFEKP